MEELLAMEAETKYLLAAGDRSHEKALMQELLRIFKEAEHLFGPRDVSFKLSTPRFTECATSRTYIIRPLRLTRIYLSNAARTTPWIASLELAHEAIHIMSPVSFSWPLTILEEGLAEWFAQRYVNRVHQMVFDTGNDIKADTVMRAVTKLLAKNEFLIKDLRTRQPEISKIDEKLLVEVARIPLSEAKFLCSDFKSYWGASSPLSAERVAACLRSFWTNRA